MAIATCSARNCLPDGLTASGTLLCAALLLKPFYILPSGSLQLGDIALIASFVAAVVHEGLSFKVQRVDLSYLAFVACVVLINGFYFCQWGTIDFVLQSIYYLFNFFTIVTFRRAMRSEKFLRCAVLTLRMDLYIQLAFYLTGFGRYYDGTANRYMGTFNDPNQLAFFMFCAFIFIDIVTTKKGLRKNPLDSIVTLFIILRSASTGMMLGQTIVLVAIFVRWITQKEISLFKVATIGAILVFTLLLALGTSRPNTPKADLFFVERLKDKVQKVIGFGEGKTDFSNSIIADRQLDKLLLYPEKMLYGAGQGAFERFTRASGTNEVHSTLPGILFYYGAVPFSIATRKKCRHADGWGNIRSVFTIRASSGKYCVERTFGPTERLNHGRGIRHHPCV